jgi:hypothetical protein
MALSAAALSLFKRIKQVFYLRIFHSCFVQKNEHTYANVVVVAMQQHTTQIYQTFQSPAGILLFQELVRVYPELGRGFLAGISRQGGPQNDLTCNLANIIRGTNN